MLLVCEVLYKGWLVLCSLALVLLLYVVVTMPPATYRSYGDEDD